MLRNQAVARRLKHGVTQRRWRVAAAAKVLTRLIERHLIDPLPGHFLKAMEISPGDRASEFMQGTRALGIKGVSLRFYRQASAERARRCA